MGTGAAHTALGEEAFLAAEKIEAEPRPPTLEHFSLRDYFAAKTVVSYTSAFDSLDRQAGPEPRPYGFTIEQIMIEQARLAYMYADAMLAARK